MTFTISQNHEIKTVVELLRKCHKQSKSLPFHDYIASTLNTDTITLIKVILPLEYHTIWNDFLIKLTLGMLGSLLNFTDKKFGYTRMAWMKYTWNILPKATETLEYGFITLTLLG